MTIDDLAQLKSNAEPNSTLVRWFEAAIPQYRVQAVLTMLKKKPLTVLQEFILKFCANGVSEIGDISMFLGVKTTTVNDAVAILQKLEMITIDIFSSKIKLLEKGKNALREAAAIVPEDVAYPVYVDGILGDIYFTLNPLYSKEHIQKLGYKSLVPDLDCPTLEYFEFDKVKNALSLFCSRYDFEEDLLSGELQEIPRIEKIYVEYKKIAVLVYMNNKTNDIRFVTYDGSTKKDEYAISLQRMYADDIHLFDFDIKTQNDSTDEHPLLTLIPSEIINNARNYSNSESTREQAIKTYEQQLIELTSQDSFMEIESASEEDRERRELTIERKRFLEGRIEELKNESSGADKILTTYEHRPLLKKALEEARQSVVIISPWIKASGMDNEIIDLICDAVKKRHVMVVIGYGMSEGHIDSDKRIIYKLETIAKDYPQHFKLVALDNTHEKVLIMDNQFMVITSFNWLSFKGDPNRGFRQETGIYTESKKTIREMKTNLSSQQRLNINLL